MNGTFDTERLSVQPWNKTEEAQLHAELEQHLNEQVTAFLPDHLHYLKGTTKPSEWAQAFQKGAEISTVRLQKEQEFAGLLMLREEAPGQIHIGYIFGKVHWGKGLATELLRGLLKHLKEIGYVGVLHAGVVKGNPASARVLVKTGFVAMKEDEERPKDVDWFELEFQKDT